MGVGDIDVERFDTVTSVQRSVDAEAERELTAPPRGLVYGFAVALVFWVAVVALTLSAT